MKEKDIKIEDLEDDTQAAFAQIVVEDALDQLGYIWDYTETSPDCTTVIVKNVRKE